MCVLTLLTKRERLCKIMKYVESTLITQLFIRSETFTSTYSILSNSETSITNECRFIKPRKDLLDLGTKYNLKKDNCKVCTIKRNTTI